jgi:hypothetical protein
MFHWVTVARPNGVHVSSYSHIADAGVSTPTFPTMTAEFFELGQTALSALRQDIAEAAAATSATHNQLVAAATLLRQATAEPGSESSNRLLDAARRIAVVSIEQSPFGMQCEFDDPGHESPLDVFRRMGDICGQHCCWTLEAHVLESVGLLASVGSITAGRVLLSRVANNNARSNWDAAAGMLDAFSDGPYTGFSELRLRAQYHRSASVRNRGNWNDAQKIHESILAEAGDRHRAIRARSLSALGGIWANREVFDRAVQYMWEAYGLTKGTGSIVESGGLGDISLVLMHAGYVAEARAAMVSLMHRASPYLLYILLGGYAEASGKLGDRAGVEWATDQTIALARRSYQARSAAQTLFECALALDAVDNTARGEEVMRRALRMAERHGFYDLPFRAEQAKAKPASSRAPLGQGSTAILDELSQMTPTTLPETLEHVG